MAPWRAGLAPARLRALQPPRARATALGRLRRRHVVLASRQRARSRCVKARRLRRHGNELTSAARVASPVISSLRHRRRPGRDLWSHPTFRLLDDRQRVQRPRTSATAKRPSKMAPRDTLGAGTPRPTDGGATTRPRDWRRTHRDHAGHECPTPARRPRGRACTPQTGLATGQSRPCSRHVTTPTTLRLRTPLSYHHPPKLNCRRRQSPRCDRRRQRPPGPGSPRRRRDETAGRRAKAGTNGARA